MKLCSSPRRSISPRCAPRRNTLHRNSTRHPCSHCSDGGRMGDCPRRSAALRPATQLVSARRRATQRVTHACTTPVVQGWATVRRRSAAHLNTTHRGSPRRRSMPGFSTHRPCSHCSDGGRMGDCPTTQHSFSQLAAPPCGASLRNSPQLVAAQRKAYPNVIDTALSPQVRRIADAFMSTPVGSLVSYAALSDTAGQDVTGRRHWITTALRVAQREAGAVFVCERTVGYRRLTTEEIPGIGFSSRKHIRSTARNATKAIVAGLRGSNGVPETVKLRASTELAVLGLVEHISRNKQVARHEAEPSPEKVGEVARTTMMRLQEAIGRT